jgi:hypothetical protein
LLPADAEKSDPTHRRWTPRTPAPPARFDGRSESRLTRAQPEPLAGFDAGRELFAAGDAMFDEVTAGLTVDDLAAATRVIAAVTARAALYEARLAGRARRVAAGAPRRTRGRSAGWSRTAFSCPSASSATSTPPRPPTSRSGMGRSGR